MTQSAQHGPKFAGSETDDHASLVSQQLHTWLHSWLSDLPAETVQTAIGGGDLGVLVNALAQAQHTDGAGQGHAQDAFLVASSFESQSGLQQSAAVTHADSFDFSWGQALAHASPDAHDATVAALQSSGTAGTSTYTPLDGTSHTAVGSTYTPVDGFNNINGDPVTHVVFSPPDNAFAANGTSVISAVNDTIGWYSADMTQGFHDEAFSQFFPSSMVGKMYFTDPRVLYDAQNGHYIVVEELYGSNSSQSKILIAVSKDSGPSGSSDPSSFNQDWNFYSINTSVNVGGKATAIDFPQAATDGKYLYISGDQFAGNSYAGSSETVIPLSAIESGAANGSLSYTPTMMASKMTMDIVADPVHGGGYFIGYDGKSSSTLGEYVTISHAASGGAIDATYKVPIGSIDNLSAGTLVATEPSGHSIDASDRRIIDAKLIGSDLFALAEVAPTGGSAPQLHWFEFDVSKLSTDPSHALVAQGDVLLPAGVAAYAGASTYNGSLAADANGDMILNFTASGPKLTPTDFYEIHKSTDGTAAATFWEAATPTQYAASPTSYSDGFKISRWGDYSSAIADPNHANGFLISNEYAVDPSHWGTANAGVLII